ncbi:hypothetical protein ABZT03_06220 [Streptomyces sp. NPDC005574]|uniref:hypothetical protein n=1 Tax=Streptomyces sp. NPDC005574 TaxID=3156891 RepID=UPI0033BC4502
MGSAWRRVGGSVALLSLAVLVLVVGVMSARGFRGAVEREREFRAAPMCVSVPVKPSGCRWEQDFTVRKADLHRGRRVTPEAELSLPSGALWTVTFPRTEPVLSEMAPGENAVGLIWHGQIVEVRDAEGRLQQTSAGPAGGPEDRLSGALACIPFGLITLVAGLWSLVAPRNRRHARATAVVWWHGVGIGVAALLTSWAQAANDWPMWAIPAVWAPFALLLLASMVAFVMAALRGDFEDTSSSPTTDAPAPPPSTV